MEGKKNERLKAARMACGLSQQELADAVGATRQTICRALGKTLDNLFWE